VNVNARTVLVSAVLLIVPGAAHSQPKASQPALPPPPAVLVPTAPPIALPAPPPPLPKSVEDLLSELERVQAQKAELDKKEQELKAVISKKLEAQAERLKKLGVAPKAAEPDRVGKIIIEGNTKTPDDKILDKLEFRPGQVLHYPALETARTKLEKAGFRGVTVEVVPGEPGATFKDVRVKVDEPKPRTPDLETAPRG
jgi:hypothetical protein